MKNFPSVVLATTLSSVPLAAVAQEHEDGHHEIDQITVTAVPLERTVEQLAQPTSVLHGDDLAKKQSTSIGETLSKEPGISSTYFGPVASRPVIRGQYGERVRVLVNGLDSLDASALSEDHQTTVEGLLAQRIEIVRGPATLLYGSGAAGGLVNVVDTRFTEQAQDKAVSGAVALGSDSATGAQDAAIRAQLGTGSVVVNADYFIRSTDNIDIPGFAESEVLRELEEAEDAGEAHEEEEQFGVVENTDSDTSGGAIGVSFLSERGFLGVSVSGFDSEYGIPGHHHEEEEGAGEEEEEESVRLDLEQVRVDLKGEYELDGTFLNAIRFRAASNDYEHVELEGDEVGTSYDTQGFDSRIELRHAPVGLFEGAVGIQYNTADLTVSGLEAFIPSSETRRTSLFIFEEVSLSDTFLLQGSARFEDQSISGAAVAEKYDDTAFSASIGAVWSASDQFRVSANLASTERHPTASELYADGAHVAVQRYEFGSVTLGNGILDKEKSLNFDLTLRGDTERFSWSVTGYVNDVDDYILLRPTGAELDEFPVFEYGQDDAEISGIEAEALVELMETDSGHMHVRVFADFVDAEEKDTGASLPRIPPRRYGLGLHGSWGDVDASVDAIFADDQDDVATDELRTEGYTLLDASVSYTFADPDLYVFLKGTNLLDEEIRYHTSPLKDLVPLPGRSVHLGLRFDF